MNTLRIVSNANSRQTTTAGEERAVPDVDLYRSARVAWGFYALFGFVLVIFATFGSVAIGRVQSVSAPTNRIVAHVIPMVMATQDIDRQVVLFEQAFSVYRQFNSTKWVDVYEFAHSQLSADYTKLATHDATFPQVRDVLSKRVQPAVEALDTLVHRAVTTADSGKPARDRSASRGASTQPPVPAEQVTWNRDMATYQQTMHELSSALSGLEADARASSDSARSSAMITIAVSMAAAVLLVGLLAFRLLRMLNAANGQLMKMATTDPLTGQPNHRMLIELLDREIARSLRYEHPCAVLFLDIDHFKVLNDTYGHSTGDSALRAFAQHVARHIRAADVLGRWGGEEFLVVLPESDGASALAAAEAIRSSVEAHEFGASCGWHITCSIGVASFPEHAQTRQDLIEAADHAMYAAKQKGRNQARLAGSSTAPVTNAHPVACGSEALLG